MKDVLEPPLFSPSLFNEKLQAIVEKHQRLKFQKPISNQSLKTFKIIKKFINENPNKPIILDSCCGVGVSSMLLGNANPKTIVLGIDQSEKRLFKSSYYK